MILGFLVNPVAGMGGRVGLKGTDNVSEKAIALGAEPVAPARSVEFLRELDKLQVTPNLDLVTCPGLMGEDELREAELKGQVLPMSRKAKTTARDTKDAVKRFVAVNASLIVFVGGDGTAKDVLDAMHGLPSPLVLGVPSGVKMYSGIFAANPRDAADVVAAVLDKSAQTTDFEVVDVDEEAMRDDRLKIRLYGFLKGPFVSMRLLGSKQVSSETEDEHENQMATAKFIIEEMNPKDTYILGPGTTVKCLADLLKVKKTLLGVDIYHNKRIINDVNEMKILKAVKDWKNTWIVVSPIGRQGILFGHGNQQISPEIIKKVGRDHVIVAATRNKIQGVAGGVLRVDTGDSAVDAILKGYIKVTVDYREWRLMKIE